MQSISSATDNAQAEFPYLLAPAAQAALLPNDERISYIGQDRWLPYPRANEIHARLEDWLKRPRVKRPPSMMIVGRSDNGKSHILEHFSQRHPAVMGTQGPNILAPVMLLQTKPSATANHLYDTITNMLNVPRAAVEEAGGRSDAARSILDVVQTRILMLDEINHLLSGPVSRQRDVLFALKYLSNALGISVVIAGTPESMQLLALSDQVENRFRLEPLPIWPVGRDFQVLLANFEQVLPLRKRSLLAKADTVKLIHSFGIETIGSISSLLNEAAKLAITTGTECITPDLLRECKPRTRKELKMLRAQL